MKRLVSVLLVCACAGLSLHGAGSVAMAKPEDVGLSSERLTRVHDAVQRHIDAGSLSGAVTLVARHGKIAHLEAHGLMDVESKKAMPKDGVFRLASMSKPITAVAVMMMVEEGKARLNDPVSRFIPEFKSMKVAVPKPNSRDLHRCAGRSRRLPCGAPEPIGARRAAPPGGSWWSWWSWWSAS